MQVTTFRNNVNLINSLSLPPIKFTILNICKNTWGGVANLIMLFTEISNDFNKLAQDKGMQNGLYLRTIMLFYAYCKLAPEGRTVQNATEFLHNSFDMDRPNSASMSRNNAVLVKLGLINLRETEDDARSKKVTITLLGEKFKKLFK
jgi:hypothetical protein